jgi:Ca2+-transporting ATPase
MRLPIMPLQILYLNMLCDVFPALALGLSDVDPGLMGRVPRTPDEPIITNKHWLAIAGYGGILALVVLAVFILSDIIFDATAIQRRTAAFLTLGFARIWHTFNMREWHSHIFHNRVVRNPFVWGGVVVCVLLLLFAVFTPVLSTALHLTVPDKHFWIMITGFSLIPLCIGQSILSLPAPVSGGEKRKK